MLNSKLIPNIQLFADGGPADPPAAPAAPAAPVAQTEPVTPPASSPTAPAGKVFSEDYVKSLRDESAGHRTRAKAYEAALRKTFGIPDGEDMGDLTDRMNKYNAANQKAVNDALAKANTRLIKAELNSLDGYDKKLLEKVIDLSKVTVDENGEVKGVKEAAEAAAKEFPAVLTNSTPKYASGTGTAQMSGDNPFNFGFTPIRKKETKN